MSTLRIVLFLAALSTLTIFVASNSSPIYLVFLGTKTQALTVGLWVAIAIALGFLTSLFLQLLSYLSRRALPASIPQPEVRKPPSSTWGRSTTVTDSQPSYAAPINDSSPDWENEVASEVDGGNSEDWDIEEPPSESYSRESPTASSTAFQRDYSNYEVKQEPKSGYQSGSVYSYGYRDSSGSGAGKTESVYDADYRVITPPYQPTAKDKDDWESNQGTADEDWGFEDEDEFDGEEASDRANRRF